MVGAPVARYDGLPTRHPSGHPQKARMFKIAPGDFSQPLGQLSENSVFLICCGFRHILMVGAPVARYDGLPARHPSGHPQKTRMFKIAPGDFSQPLGQLSENPVFSFVVDFDAYSWSALHQHCHCEERFLRRGNLCPCSHSNIPLALRDCFATLAMTVYRLAAACCHCEERFLRRGNPGKSSPVATPTMPIFPPPNDKKTEPAQRAKHTCLLVSGKVLIQR